MRSILLNVAAVAALISIVTACTPIAVPHATIEDCVQLLESTMPEAASIDSGFDAPRAQVIHNTCANDFDRLSPTSFDELYLPEG